MATPEHHATVDDLIAHGIPVFTAPPASGDPHREFYMPKGWTDTQPDPTWARGFKTGHAIFGCTGHGLDVIDIDPKNSADVNEQLNLAASYGIPIVGHVLTPSMGAHLYIPSTGLANCAIINSGVDFRGTGGAVFLPGTQRPKYHGGGYQWLRRIDWNELADWQPHTRELRARVENYLTKLGWDPMGVKRRRAGASEEIIDTHVGPLPSWLYDAARDHTGPWELADGSITTDRSSRFQSLVSACYHLGLTFAQTVTVVRPWCEGNGKFADRVTSETMRSWEVCREG